MAFEPEAVIHVTEKRLTSTIIAAHLGFSMQVSHQADAQSMGQGKVDLGTLMPTQTLMNISNFLLTRGILLWRARQAAWLNSCWVFQDKL